MEKEQLNLFVLNYQGKLEENEKNIEDYQKKKDNLHEIIHNEFSNKEDFYDCEFRTSNKITLKIAYEKKEDTKKGLVSETNTIIEECIKKSKLKNMIRFILVGSRTTYKDVFNTVKNNY